MSKRMCRSEEGLSVKGTDTEIRGLPEDNCRDTCTSARCLSELCLSEHLSDVSFTFNDDLSVKLPAHKLILSMRSSVFETMFYGSLPEKGETVHIEDVEHEVMKLVLQYIYMDKTKINENNVFDCFYTANKYDLPGLAKQCCNYLENIIDETKVFDIYEQATLCEMKTVKDKCFAFIIANAKSILSSPGIFKLSHEMMLDILKNDGLIEREIDIFKAVLKWAEYRCEENNLSTDGQNVRKQLGEAIFEVRFPLISIEDFARFVTPSGILTNDEQVMLYQYMATKGSTPLGKFKQQSRSDGISVQIDLEAIPRSLQFSVGRVLKIKYDSLPTELSVSQPRRKSIKLEAVIGSFVGKVYEINVHGNMTADYEAKGNKIIFMDPIDLSDKTIIKFSTHTDIEKNFIRGEYFTHNIDMTYNTNHPVAIKGQNITITSIPEGLESIIFV